MSFTRASLHAPVAISADHLEFIRKEVASFAIVARGPMELAPPSLDVVEIALTTVSLLSNFDANIRINFEGAAAEADGVDLLVDSGNSVLVVPYWEQIQTLTGYQVLAENATEPFECPAKVVRGPILIPTTRGEVYRIDNCVFYACTADSPLGGGRTANFGTGCLSPWTDNPAAGLDPLQAPLSYNATCPCAEFDYEAESVMTAGSSPKVAAQSYLRLYKEKPAGYQMFNILPNLEWMSLVVKQLTIEGTKVVWPEGVTPIAMIDTGGGPVFLSQPNGYVFGNPWPDDVQNPDWTKTSAGCESTKGGIGIEVGDNDTSFAYAIDPARLPAAGQGLTLVMCTVNAYMMGQQGINVGGISALINDVLIDYKNLRVGLRAK